MDINLAIADRARAGETLTAAELDELASADLLSLGMLADEVRRSRVGDTVTYVRVFEWPAMTGGDKPSGGPGGNRRGQALGLSKAGEVRIAALPESLDDCDRNDQGRDELRQESGVLAAFSLADIIDRAWAPLADVLEQLKAAGLDAIAEAPIDRIAHLEEALQACRDAAISVRCLSLQKPAG